VGDSLPSYQLDRNHLNAYLDCVVLLRQGTTTRLFGHTASVRPRTHNANAYELMGAMLMQQGRSKEAIAAPKVSNAGSKTPVCFCSWDLFG